MEIHDTYIDVDGLKVSNTMKVPEVGVIDEGAIRSGYAVKFTFGNDSAIPRNVSKKHADAGSIYDGFFTHVNDLDDVQEIIQDSMANLYESNVIQDNILAMRRELVHIYRDNTPSELAEALSIFDSEAAEALVKIGIDPFDADFQARIRDPYDWYGAS